MAKLTANLRNEELLGGFEPHPEDDVFLLERIPGYPGTLPYEPKEAMDLDEPAEAIAEEILEEAPLEAVAEEISEPAVEEAEVKLDNEFLSMLQSDLEKSEERKHQEMAVQSDENLPIDEAENAQIIDLTAINPDEEKTEAETEEKISDTVIDSNGEIKPAEKKKFPMVALLAAALVLLAIAGGSGYMYWQSLQPHPKENKPLIAEAKKPEPKKEEPKKEAEPVKTDPQHPEIIVTEPKPLEDAPIIVKQEPKKEEPKVADIKEPPKPVAEKPKPAPEKIVEAKITPKPAAPKPERKIARIEKKIFPQQMQMKKSVGEGVFTVQVAATPSADDADEWVERLRSKNISNATKSRQNIRGQEYYRIRFGSFKSREEAEEAARRLGYAQSWVVQVR